MIQFSQKISKNVVYLLDNNKREIRDYHLKLEQNIKNLNDSNLYNTEKAMAPHSSTLAWKILWTEEPGGLQFMRSRRVGHN